MTGGSISISNIGSAWGQWFTPIINFPEVAIFGMGRIEKKPIVLADDTFGIGNMMYLSLSFDHRIIDGALAQKAMNEIKSLLSDPELLLMIGKNKNGITHTIYKSVNFKNIIWSWRSFSHAAVSELNF